MNPQPVNIADIFSPAKSFPTIGSLVSTITANAFYLAGIVAFIFIIAGGFAIITGSGDPKKMESGQKTLTMAITGLLIIVFSYWIVKLIGLILGVDPLKLYGQ